MAFIPKFKKKNIEAGTKEFGSISSKIRNKKKSVEGFVKEFGKDEVINSLPSEYKSHIEKILESVQNKKQEWTIVTFRPKEGKWGIVDDVFADSKEEALEIGRKNEDGHDIKDYSIEAFIADSEELNKFIDENPFIE